MAIHTSPVKTEHETVGFEKIESHKNLKANEI